MALPGRHVGTYRHEITITERAFTSDSGGGQTPSDPTVFEETFANIRPLKRGERILGAQLQEETTHIVETAFIDGLNADMQIVFGARTFKISHIHDPNERGVTQVIEAQETKP